MPLTPHACSNCQAPVQVRRPSKDGHHWCKQTLCQTAKQRHYRTARNTEGDNLILQLVTSLAHLERTACGCGLQNALPGWAHRDPSNPNQPCYRSGSAGPGLPQGMLDAIHPELRP